MIAHLMRGALEASFSSKKSMKNQDTRYPRKKILKGEKNYGLFEQKKNNKIK